MRYAQVKEGVITNLFPQKPNWFWDNGEQVTDDWLRTEQIYPIIEDHDNDINYVEKDQSQWIYRTMNVEVTYFQYIDDLPECNLVTHKRVMKPEDQWITSTTNSTITRTYDIVARTLDETYEFISSKPVYMPEGFVYDQSKFIEKPMEMWEYNEEDGHIRKRFWEIIPDLTANDVSDILYHKEPAPFEEWPKTDTTTQEIINILPRDLEDITERVLSSAADIRWQIETGGLKIGEINMFTERETQSKLTSAYMLMKLNNSTADVTWKTIDGFKTFTAQEFENICLLVHQFVQESFTKEALYMNEVKTAGTFEQLEILVEEIYTKLAVENSYHIANLG